MNIDRLISLVIIIFLIIGSIGIFYIILNPSPTEKFTEFYLLGSNGTASDYPTNLSIGQKGNVNIGIVNHENSTTNYQIRILQDNTLLKQDNITLRAGEKKEIPFEFTASSKGVVKIQFNLYKLPNNENIYRLLQLNVNVV